MPGRRSPIHPHTQIAGPPIIRPVPKEAEIEVSVDMAEMVRATAVMVPLPGGGSAATRRAVKLPPVHRRRRAVRGRRGAHAAPWPRRAALPGGVSRVIMALHSPRAIENLPVAQASQNLGVLAGCIVLEGVLIHGSRPISRHHCSQVWWAAAGHPRVRAGRVQTKKRAGEGARQGSRVKTPLTDPRLSLFASRAQATRGLEGA